LVVAKSGLKMKETEIVPPSIDAAARTPVTPSRSGLPRLPPGFHGILHGAFSLEHMFLSARMASVVDLASELSGPARRPVVDGTGLTGLYDFTLEYSMDVPGGNAGTAGPAVQPGQAAANEPSAPSYPSLAAAIEQQLGLKFESRKGPIDVLVVDRVESAPKEN